jgi:hypothetical protein
MIHLNKNRLLEYILCLEIIQTDSNYKKNGNGFVAK